MATNKVFIFDYNEKDRTLLRSILNSFPNTEIIGESSFSKVSLQSLRKQKPNLVFIDTFLPDMAGFDFVKRIKPLLPATYFVATCRVSENFFILQSFKNGVHEFLVKPYQKQEIESILEISSRILK